MPGATVDGWVAGREEVGIRGAVTALAVDDVRYSVPASRTRRHRRQGRQILNGVSLSLERGTSVAVMGPSGAGKSTLLSVCMGLLAPSSGSVSLAGHAITGVSKRRAAALRSSLLGVVFQSGELLPELSPLDNVALPAMLRGDRKDVYQKAGSLLSLMGLDVQGTPTSGLSGGERQRVAVARSLINHPVVILADEPTGSLDGPSRDQVADHLFSLPPRLGCGLLTVTHDPHVAARADRVFDLASGVLRLRE